MLALLNVAMLETLNVLAPSGLTFGGKPATKGVLPRSLFSPADVASANASAASISAAVSFAGYGVLAYLFPSRAQALPPFLDGVVALHLTSPLFGINYTLPADSSVVGAAQRIGSLAARTIVASKLGDGFATYKSYTFNQTLAATSVPPLNQYRPTLIFPQAMIAAFSNAGAQPNLTNAPVAFVYPQLQSVTPIVSASASAWTPNSKQLKVLGVADPNQPSPFFTQPVTGIPLANTLPADAANSILGAWYNISNSANSTADAAADWMGYNYR